MKKKEDYIKYKEELDDTMIRIKEQHRNKAEEARQYIKQQREQSQALKVAISNIKSRSKSPLISQKMNSILENHENKNNNLNNFKHQTPMPRNKQDKINQPEKHEKHISFKELKLSFPEKDILNNSKSKIDNNNMDYNNNLNKKRKTSIL